MPIETDVVVIGAGISGIYATYKMRRELGLDCVCLDKGDSIGGTWNWNRYPGAKADTESFAYRYLFDRDALTDWNWSVRYADQQEMFNYLNWVVDRHALRDSFTLNTSVRSMTYNADAARWTVVANETNKDEDITYTCSHVVLCVGVLSEPVFPAIPGLDKFRGELVHTARWDSEIDLSGKTVGLIGTGSTGTQFLVEAAALAKELIVFQRTAQYVVPSSNGLADPNTRRTMRRLPDSWKEQLHKSRLACGFNENPPAFSELTAEQARSALDEAWSTGNGFRFMFGTFADMILNEEANEFTCDYIRDKIDEIVQDPATAGQLHPSGFYAKRPISTDGYYEAFNNENTHLVSLRNTPIIGFSDKGPVTSDGTTHKVDMLVCATGFETVVGALNNIRIEALGNYLDSSWRRNPRSLFGVSAAGFPNLHFVLGPQSAFTNLPPTIETQVDYIAEIIKARKPLVAKTDCVNSWFGECDSIAKATLFAKTSSWIFGQNTRGADNAHTMFYFGGLGEYRQRLTNEVTNGFSSYAAIE